MQNRRTSKNKIGESTLRPQTQDSRHSPLGVRGAVPARQSSTSRLKALSQLARPVSLMLGMEAPLAVEIPDVGSPIQLQTNGAAAPLGNGDWYTNASQGNGFHYLALQVPNGWPSELVQDLRRA